MPNTVRDALTVSAMFARLSPDEMKMDESANYRGYRFEELFDDVIRGFIERIIESSIRSILHLACEKGDLQCVNRNLCLRKNCSGKSALHIAAEIGFINLILRYCESVEEVTATTMETCLHVAVKHDQIDAVLCVLNCISGERPDLINLILRYCSESVNEVTDTTGDTCLHLAVKNKQIDVVRRLLKCVTGERPDFLHVLDFKDYKRKTAVQFSKQFQALRVFLPLNSGGSVAIDISYDQSYLSFLGIRWEPLTKHKIKHTGDYSQKGLSNGACYLMEEKIKQNDSCSPRGLSNGSRDLTEEKIKHNDNCSPRGLSNSSRDFTIQIIEPNDDYSHRGLLNWSSNRSIVEPSVRFRIGLLLIATLILATTFQVPFHFLGSTSKEGYEQHSIICSLIISGNSLVFIASVGVITNLLQEFPLKPLSHSLILALFGCYILSVHAIMPNGALVLFFISIPILSVAICKEALWLCKPKTHLSTSGDVSSC